jgi:LuxR family maltose regulon positive regulatory protein
MIYLGMATAYQQMDDYARSAEAFRNLIQYGRAGNPISELLGVSGLGLMSIQRGELHFAFELVSQALDRIERSGSLPPISTALFGELGVIHYHWHQLEQAHRCFRRAIQVSTLSGYSDAEVYYGVILARLFQIGGDLEAASAAIQKTVDLMQLEAPAAVREEVIAQYVRVLLAQNRLAPAEAALKDYGFSFQGEFIYPPVEPGQNLSRSVGLLYLSALRILLYRAQVNRELVVLGRGVQLASLLLENALQHHYIPYGLETLLLRSQMQAALGDDSANQADIRHALELAEPEGFISLFLEEGAPVAKALANLPEQYQASMAGATASRRFSQIRTILAAFAEHDKPGGRLGDQADIPAPPEPASLEEPLLEPLSGREREILQLIGEGCSNQEIADRLVITLHTVKKHSSNIYAKLGVTSRTQALARARRLHLI